LPSAPSSPPPSPENPPSAGGGFALSSGDPVAQAAKEPAVQASAGTIQNRNARDGAGSIEADLLKLAGH
jgi:hypothetical protein